MDKLPSRRNLLRTIVGGIPIVLSGCLSSEENPPNSEGQSENQNPTQDDNSTSNSEVSQHLDQYRAYLSTENIQYTAVDYTGDPIQVQVSYISQAATDQEIATEIGVVAGGFMQRLEDGMDATRLDATIQNEAEEAIARWHMLAEWYEEFQNGEISDQELSARFLNTVETVDSE